MTNFAHFINKRFLWQLWKKYARFKFKSFIEQALKCRESLFFKLVLKIYWLNMTQRPSPDRSMIFFKYSPRLFQGKISHRWTTCSKIIPMGLFNIHWKTYLIFKVFNSFMLKDIKWLNLIEDWNFCWFYPTARGQRSRSGNIKLSKSDFQDKCTWSPLQILTQHNLVHSTFISMKMKKNIHFFISLFSYISSNLSHIIFPFLSLTLFLFSFHFLSCSFSFPFTFSRTRSLFRSLFHELSLFLSCSFFLSFLFLSCSFFFAFFLSCTFFFSFLFFSIMLFLFFLSFSIMLFLFLFYLSLSQYISHTFTISPSRSGFYFTLCYSSPRSLSLSFS